MGERSVSGVTPAQHKKARTGVSDGWKRSTRGEERDRFIRFKRWIEHQWLRGRLFAQGDPHGGVRSRSTDVPPPDQRTTSILCGHDRRAVAPIGELEGGHIFVVYDPSLLGELPARLEAANADDLPALDAHTSRQL